MINAYSDEEDMISHVRDVARKRSAMDMKMLIRAVLEMPVASGRTYTIDDVGSVAELSKLNTDVRTRILLNVSRSAAAGDIKSAEFLFKYGGYTPVIEQNVSVRLPQIINDLAPPEEEELINVTPKEELLSEVAAVAIGTSEMINEDGEEDTEQMTIDPSTVRFADE